MSQYKKSIYVTTIIIVIATYLILIPILNFLIKSNTPMCIYSNIFHAKCWGCGMTRAFYSFLKFDYAKGIEYNFLIIFVFPLSFICYVKYVYLTLLKICKFYKKQNLSNNIKLDK